MSAANDNGRDDEPEDTYRIIIEGEKDGIEWKGWSGIKRSRIEEVAEAIARKAIDFVAVGKLAPRRTIAPMRFGKGRGRK